MSALLAGQRPLTRTDGYLLLEMLSLDGWSVGIEGDGAGGVVVKCRKDEIKFDVPGASVAAVAVTVFEIAQSRRRRHAVA